VKRHESKRPLEKSRRMWEDNIECDIKVMGTNYIQLGLDKVQWKDMLKTVMTLPVL
jgi:AAA+ ATPase superfamily predicted ATPase